jgi:hypothetical protein
MAMDERDVDALARLVAGSESRRAALRLLAGGALGGLAARLGLAEGAAARPKKQHKRRPEPKSRETLRTEGKRKGKGKGKKAGKKKPRPAAECTSDTDCPACDRCEGGTCQAGLNALCSPALCQEPVCNITTNSWECTSTCQHSEAVCCKGTCFAPCSNGRSIDPETCECKQCEEVCNPGELCSWPGCRAGERCINGLCNSICTNPSLPQLCCAKNEWTGQVYCGCAEANTICFNCGGAVCGCNPGTEHCCDPSVHGPNCPEECACQ